MPPEICLDCDEVVPPDYVINTGDLYICGPDAITRDLGNVQVLDFSFRPNTVEHRKGKDGSLDAIMPLSEDFMLVATVDQIAPALMAYLLGVDMVNVAEGCEIPFKSLECDRKYAVQFVHAFRCADRTLTIDMWAALIISEFTMQFGQTIANVPMNIRATKCESVYPDKPYGRMLFSQTCPAS